MHLLMYVQKEEWRNKEEQLVKARNDEIKKNLMIQQQLEAEKGKSQGISAQLEAAQAQLVALKAQKTAEMAELKASHTAAIDQVNAELAESKQKVAIAQATSHLSESWDERSGPQQKQKQATLQIEELSQQLAAAESRAAVSHTRVEQCEEEIKELESMVAEAEHVVHELEQQLEEAERLREEALKKQPPGAACLECPKLQQEIEALQVPTLRS